MAGIPAGPVVQAMKILRDGRIVEVDDDHVLASNERHIDDDLFSVKPRVMVSRGTKLVTADEDGDFSVGTTTKPAKHMDLQRRRRQQGREVRARLKRLQPSEVEQEVKRLKEAADEIESLAGDFLPKTHTTKVRKLYRERSVKGQDFRGLTDCMDEATQSATTSAYFGGYGESGGDTPVHYSQLLDDFGEEALRVCSSLRLPTQDVVAPIPYLSAITGQQHPTSSDQPKLPGGASGHAYADRARSESQVRAHRSLACDPKTRPSDLLLGSALGATVSTLSTMSAPLEAENVPDFNVPRHQTQAEHRGRLKEQGEAIAEQLGIPTAQETQSKDAPWKPWVYPISPRRTDDDMDSSDSDT